MLGKLEQLKQTLPTTAELIEASIKFDEDKDTTAFHNVLNNAENEDEDIYIFFKLHFHDTYGKPEDLLKYMRQFAEKCPALNKPIAESHMDEYEKDGDIENVKRAMECYRNMDEHGMLNASAASQMLKTYLEFKDKGLEVVSVSVDVDEAAWLKAVREDKLTWTYNVRDLKGQAANLYGITLIPCVLLLDEDNRILGRNLPKEELRRIVEEKLN